MAYLAVLAFPSMRHPGDHTLQPSVIQRNCRCSVLSKTAAHKWALAHPACNVMQAEMAGTAETAAILDALNSQRADARERQAAMERQIREEARRLRGGIAGQPPATDSPPPPPSFFMQTGMFRLVLSSCPAAALTLSQAAAGSQLLVEHAAYLPWLDCPGRH